MTMPFSTANMARCKNDHHWLVRLPPGKNLLPDDVPCPSCGEEVDAWGPIPVNRMVLTLSVPRTGSASNGDLVGGDMVVANMVIPRTTGLGEVAAHVEMLALVRAELPNIYERLAALLSGTPDHLSFLINPTQPGDDEERRGPA